MHMASFKIITIDDSNVIRKIINQVLKPFEVIISEAENGAEGLQKIKQNKPDLIILDLTMPVMDGLDH
jgi:two-component system cell cycle response regulator